MPKQTIMAYFEANWFTEEWLGMTPQQFVDIHLQSQAESWTDFGLPDDQYREGIWSTNNWTERAFKTFDQVFLDRRANKS